MSKAAFDKIAADLEDAIAFAGGNKTRSRIATPIDVKKVCAATKKSQSEFASTYRLPVASIRDWEQSRRQPDAPARVVLSMIEADPAAVEPLIARASAA